MKLRFETLEPRLVMTGVVINEILASSSGTFIQDEDGDDSDYIELYNSGETAVDLDGWYLTDNDGNLAKWALPAEQLDPGEYLVIFASSKNRAIAGGELHTNFNLSADGEYLALVQPDGTTIEMEYAPEFPEQFGDKSYGLADIFVDDVFVGQELRYFDVPTPGAENGEGVLGFVENVEVSEEHGYFEDDFYLELETDTPGAQIYYSYDGSIPTPGSPTSYLYDDPILIHHTTPFRAAAYKEDYGRSYVTTETYIFLEDVLTQTISASNPASNPFGLDYSTRWQGLSGDWNMDPQIVAEWDDNNPANDDHGIREALLSLPTMSIVMDHDEVWGPNGIYPNADEEGDEWRLPGSIEYFDPEGGSDFQENVGIQMQGGASRMASRTKKHSFRLIFNPEFGGPGRLEFPLFDQSDFDDINTVVLKGGNQDSFPTRTYANKFSPLTATYMRDQWMLDTSRDMGNMAVEFKYVHLYVNGLYWGMYCAMERTDDARLSSRLGGEPEDWDVIRPSGEYTGSLDAWNEMFALARTIPSNNTTVANSIYHKLQGLNPDGTRNEAFSVHLDMDSLIDYLALHYYAGAQEWVLVNFVYARNRLEPDTGFQFFVWDQDSALDGFFHNAYYNNAVPGYSVAQELSSLLKRSPEFRIRFADRLEELLAEGGAMSDGANIERWLTLEDKIDAAMIGETARWGDAREGESVVLKTGDPSVVLPVMTVDLWRESVQDVIGYFAESRTRLITRLKGNGLYPALDSALINQRGGTVVEGFDVELSKPESSPVSSTIYYTLDGSDPRLNGGGLNPAAIAYSGPIDLLETANLKARIRDGSTWSALLDTSFTVVEPPPERLPGDYDNNGTVENIDYDVWKASYGEVVIPNTSGDGNGDGGVDAVDYTIWRNNYVPVLPVTPDYKFNSIGQTYAQNFNIFLGTEETLPDHFTATVVAGTDIFRGTFDSTTDSAASFTGIKASTSDGSNYSLTWRESTGPANLEDTRFLFMLTNNTGEAISGFNVSYDVETWVNGRRDNVLRFKYDVYADSDESQAAEGRNAFESDIFSTDNPNHTPIANNDLHFVLDGKHPDNRETVSGYVDLTTLLIDQANPGLGAFGALQPGETAYFRWQISNGALTSGNRSALGIDNVSITALAAPPAVGSGGFAVAAPVALELKAESAVRSAAADLAIAELTASSSARPATRSDATSPIVAATSIADELLVLASLDRAAPDTDDDEPVVVGEAESESEAAATLDDLALELAIAAF